VDWADNVVLGEERVVLGAPEHRDGEANRVRHDRLAGLALNERIDLLVWKTLELRIVDVDPTPARMALVPPRVALRHAIEQEARIPVHIVGVSAECRNEEIVERE